MDPLNGEAMQQLIPTPRDAMMLLRATPIVIEQDAGTVVSPWT
jgi:hypothetical protein